jgi:RNA polymerase sigma factor (sigma-70 family)
VDTVPTAKLVAAAVSGDQAAWDALLERYSRLVWAVARSYRLSEPDLKDVSQTTWLRLVENLGSLREPEHLAGWLATTAKREAIKVLTNAGREVPVFDELDELTAQDASGMAQDPEALALADDENQRLWRAYAGLSPSCKNLLWLVTAVPLGSYAEVSAALEMPVGSIGPTRKRCLKYLRALLAPQKPEQGQPKQ